MSKHQLENYIKKEELKAKQKALFTLATSEALICSKLSAIFQNDLLDDNHFRKDDVEQMKSELITRIVSIRQSLDAYDKIALQFLEEVIEYKKES